MNYASYVLDQLASCMVVHSLSHFRLNEQKLYNKYEHSQLHIHSAKNLIMQIASDSEKFN